MGVGVLGVGVLVFVGGGNVVTVFVGVCVLGGRGILVRVAVRVQIGVGVFGAGGFEPGLVGV